MNLIQRAYLQGKQAAEAKFAPVAAPTPKAPTQKAPQSATTPATATSKPPTKAPANLSLPQRPAMPGMAGSSASSAASGLQSNASALAALSAPALAQQSATQQAVNTINQTGMQMLGPIPKMADFNMGMTPDPSTKPDAVPKGDNGRRMYGTQFNDPTRPTRDVAQAFASHDIPKNTDVLNDMGQMAFGAPRG